MSFGGITDANTFYSEPNPEAIGSPRLEEKGQIDRANEIPAEAATPPYARYQDAASFAPMSAPPPADFKPAMPEPEPPVVSIPMIAVGLFVLWMLYKGAR